MTNKTKVLDELKNPRGKTQEGYFTPKSKNGLSKVEGILTSAIQTKTDTNEPHNQWAAYYLAFFQLEGIEQDNTLDIPVIFRLKDNLKPKISPQAKVLLTGQWVESSNSPRPSFTCQEYQILANPSPPTIKELFKQISSLLTISLKKQTEWKQRTDHLFRKRKDLEEIDQLSKLGKEYLSAYLLLRKAYYSNYQDNLLHVSPHLTSQEYLNKIASELEDVACQVRAYQAKEL